MADILAEAVTNNVAEWAHILFGIQNGVYPAGGRRRSHLHLGGEAIRAYVRAEDAEEALKQHAGRNPEPFAA